jgi:AcrR family transcriptional regulator
MSHITRRIRELIIIGKKVGGTGMPKQTFHNLPSEKQEKIMRASISEFVKNGFEKGNVGEIAKNAGVAKGSMYQYFDDKKELFLSTVQWSIRFLMLKYSDKLTTPTDQNTNIFDYLAKNAKDIMLQMKEDRELVIFIQDVFLGKYQAYTDETMAYITKLSNEHILKLIKNGKQNGSIRSDISDHILSLFITGVTYKIKEYIMTQARNQGADIIDEGYEVYESEINAMVELLKNGMGGK